MYTSMAALVLVAGCFAPHAPSDVPCDPARPACPDDQACRATGTGFACLSHAAPDAMAEVVPDMTVDTDGDGISDGADNCPSVANPDQDNYDGDRFGDACDPCPPYANDAPIDSDGDGVSDECDPDPATPGDSIVVFDSFRHGLDRWHATGTWTIVDDGASVDLGVGARAMLELPAPVATRFSVVAAFTAAALANPPPYAAGMGVVSDAIACELVLTSGGDSRIALVNTSYETSLASAGHPLALDTPYATAITKTDQVYRCRATPTELTKSSNSASANPELGIRALGARGVFHWTMVLANAPH